VRGLAAPGRPHHEEVAVPLFDQLHQGLKLEVRPAFQRDPAPVVQVDLQRPWHAGLGDLGVHDPLYRRFVDRTLDLQVLFNRPGQALEDLGVLAAFLPFHHGGARVFLSHRLPRFPASCFPESAFPDPVSVNPILS